MGKRLLVAALIIAAGVMCTAVTAYSALGPRMDGGGTVETSGDVSSSETTGQVGKISDSETEKTTQELAKPEERDEKLMYLKVNGETLEVELANTEAAKALEEKLADGDLTINTSGYGGFEQVGSLGFSLPTSNSQTTTSPGDVVLYQGSQIVIFYGTNSWSYTRLGKFKEKTADELKALLGDGDLVITLGLK